jgi:UDP-N-acetylmuramate--alanine ligase
LLVRDGGIRGVVIHPSKGEFDTVTRDGDTLTCGAGARLKKIASAAREARLGGFEWMEGIPGNLGGSIRMNAGAMGVETFDQIVSVTFLDSAGELHTRQLSEIEHHYRNVPQFTTSYAVAATLRGKANTPLEEIDHLLEQSKQKRRIGQPIAASAGCIFKNPSEIPAGKLVQELGYKDRAVGNAKVSVIHGNFIVNEGGASAKDVLELIDHIKKESKEERSIVLETEVQIIGQDGIL